MAVELTPFGKFVKWVAFPALLVVVGVKCIGPKIGASASGVIPRIASGFRHSAPPGDPATPGGSAAKPGVNADGANHAADFERVRDNAVPPPPGKRIVPTTDVPDASAEPVAPRKPRRRSPHAERPPIDQTNN